MEHQINRFIIRVYGIVFNDKAELLVSDEKYQGTYMTKFVGGGLEFGEGPVDCLKREFLEECGVEIIPGRIFHVTDQFVQSAFHPEGQLLSIYFFVKFKNDFQSTTLIPPHPWKNGAQYFKWKALEHLDEKALTWPSDQEVIRRLKAEGLKE